MKIRKDVYQQMIDHCQAELPNEGCGYLAGSDDIMDTIYKMRNVDASPEHFSFDPTEQFKVVKQVRAEQRQLKVVYHSHPETPARLSQEDLRLLNDPEMVYMIVSLRDKDPETKAFQISKENNEINIKEIQYEIL